MKFSDLNILDVGSKYGLVGAVFGDENLTMLCMLPDATFKDPQILPMDDKDWRKFLRQTDLMEVEVLQMTEDGKLAKAILRKTQRVIEGRVSWGVYKRDKYKCRYCGRDGIPLTVDHLVLWEEGGPSIPENLVTSCRKCNKVRGNTQYAKWLEHPYYLKVMSGDNGRCPGVGAKGELLNDGLVGTLDAIPRNYSERKTRK